MVRVLDLGLCGDTLGDREVVTVELKARSVGDQQGACESIDIYGVCERSIPKVVTKLEAYGDPPFVLV